MKFKLEILLGMTLVGGVVGAATYHVDSLAGEDSRDGLSEATAWRSLKRVNAAQLQPGDRMLFKRGGLWRGSLDLKSGAPGSRICYGAYGSGPKPILQGSVERDRPDDWVEVKPGLWSTLIRENRDVEQLLPASALTNWNAVIQYGVKGTCRWTREGSEEFLRFACTEMPKEQPSATAVQLWGAQMQGKPAPMRFRFKVRGDIMPDTCDVLLNRPPWRKPYTSKVKIAEAPDAQGWREAEAFFAGDDISGEGLLHFNVGHRTKAGGKIDIMPMGVWRAANDPRRQIGADVGILIFGDETAWGVKKWSMEELEYDRDYWYDAENDRVVVKMSGNPAEIFRRVELCLTRVVVPHGGKHDVTVEAFTVRYSGGFAFGGAGAENVTVRNCDMYFIGGGLQYWHLKHWKTGKPAPVRYGNGVEYWGAKHCRVERCRIWQVYDAALTPQCSGKAAVFDDVAFVDNVIWQSEYSFEFWNHSASGSTANVVFEHNTCVDAGDCWSHSQRPDQNGAHVLISTHEGAMTNQVIRNNVFCRSTERAVRFRKGWYLWRDKLELDHNLVYEPINIVAWCAASEADRAAGARTVCCGSGPDEFARYRRLTGFDAHSIYAKPDFVAPDRRDYRLKPGSPGCGAASDGTDMGARNMPGLDQDQSL